MWWPLTLTYIFKVIRPWLRKSCPLCSVYSSGWIIFIYGTNDHYYQRVCCVLLFFKYENLNFWQFLKSFRPWPWKRSFGLGLENRVRSVASIVLDGFFPYLVQMITSMRRCVACDDLWPWPISSRSSDLDLENRVRSVASTVLNGLFLYMAQMITIIRGCVVCYFFF